MLARRSILALLFAAGILVFFCAPAFATLVESGITCSGSAVITDPDGKTYTINADDSTVTLPHIGKAAWKGAVVPPTHHHSGEVVGEVGPFGATFGTWSSANDLSLGSKNGVKDYEIPDWLPPLELVVSGFHQGDEGRCEGDVIVDLDGSVTSSALGLGILGGTILFGALTVASGFGKGGA